MGTQSLSCLSGKGVGNPAHPKELVPPSATIHYYLLKSWESAEFSQFLKWDAAIPDGSPRPLDLRITAGLPSSEEEPRDCHGECFYPSWGIQISLTVCWGAALPLKLVFSQVLQCSQPTGAEETKHRQAVAKAFPAGDPSCCPSQPPQALPILRSIGDFLGVSFHYCFSPVMLVTISMLANVTLLSLSSAPTSLPLPKNDPSLRKKSTKPKLISV